MDFEGSMYQEARERAAKWNPTLRTRQGAADQLGVSVYTLADYELGNTKVVPVDKVVLMADLYNAPELRNVYCKTECPIGKHLALAERAGSIEGATLRLLYETQPRSFEGLKGRLMEIVRDGVIDDTEKDGLREILKRLDTIAVAISELKASAEKALREGET